MSEFQEGERAVDAAADVPLAETLAELKPENDGGRRLEAATVKDSTIGALGEAHAKTYMNSVADASKSVFAVAVSEAPEWPYSRLAAVALAKRGFRTLRLNHRTLRPRQSGWPETASSDPEVVYKDFTDAVGESVNDAPAIATGRGLVVCDIDVKKGRAGLLSLAELLAEGLPEHTLTVRTASGGLHKYYWHDPEIEIRNRTGFMDGVDIRGFNGYVVAPGASREGVGDYTIINDAPPAQLPATFVANLGRRHKDREAIEVTDKYEDDWSVGEAIKLLAALEPIDGQKHNDLVATWHKCFDLGVTPETLAELTPQHVEWFVALYTQDLDSDLGSIVAGRVRDGKAWGIDHPRARPSVYSTFERVALLDPSHERPRDEKPGESAATVSLAGLAGKLPAPRTWFVPDLIPDRTVTPLMGDGGVGKSLLTMQLCAAAVTNREWLGMPVKQGPVLYAGAEDELDEIHRRMIDISRGEGFSIEELVDFHVLALAGLDAVMSAPDGRGNVRPTKLWEKFERQVARLRPASVVLDTLADVYAGEENARAQVRQFVGTVRGLAINYDLTAIILGHPSVNGMDSGSGTSGSTGWNNSVRSRLYLRRPEKESERKRDPNLRVLETMKQNYAAGVGDERLLRWEAGRFVTSTARITVEADGDALFLTLLERFISQGRDVSPEPRATLYAPKFFAEQPEAQTAGVDEKAMKAAMERLFTRGEIVAERHGPPSKKWRRIAKKAA